MTDATPNARAGSGANDTADIVLIFDGGAIGNPGRGYGSFTYKGRVVRWPTRVDFPGVTTNNQAEYRTLLAALSAILDDLEVTGQNPGSLTLEVRSDSQLVVNQVNRRWKVKKAELKPLRDSILDLRSRFGHSVVVWHPRSESVRVLGH